MENAKLNIGEEVGEIKKIKIVKMSMVIDKKRDTPP